jgi:hypothetical protein
VSGYGVSLLSTFVYRSDQYKYVFLLNKNLNIAYFLKIDLKDENPELPMYFEMLKKKSAKSKVKCL